MRDLNRHIVEQQAAQWETLGLELGLKDYRINIKVDDAIKKIKQPTTTTPVSIDKGGNYCSVLNY